MAERDKFPYGENTHYGISIIIFFASDFHPCVNQTIQECAMIHPTKLLLSRNIQLGT